MIAPPYVRILMAAAALVGAGASGALVEHWRLGNKYQAAKAARVSALNERQSKAMVEALEVTTRLQKALTAAWKANAALVAKAVQDAPKGPQWDCRQTPLPETYLENFRK